MRDLMHSTAASAAESRASDAWSSPPHELRGASPAPFTASASASAASNRLYTLTSSPSPTATSASAYAFATLSPNGATILPGLDLSSDRSNNDKQRALLERRRKQRELKRKSRARKKTDVESMKDEVALLEAKYEQLCAVAAAGNNSSNCTIASTALPQSDSTSNSRHTALLIQYTQARDEMATLRDDIAAAKQRLSAFDVFASAVESYTDEVATFPSSHTNAEFQPPFEPSEPVTPSPPLLPFEPLSPDTCYEIIQTCYQQIVAPQYRGTRMSTGASLFGWCDERFVDGATLQFALKKRFGTGNVTADNLMHATWAIVTTAEHMHTIQKTTLSVDVLQRLNDDVVVTQRVVHHPQLARVVCVNLLMFRLRTARGFIVAYVTIEPPTTAPTTYRHTGGATLAWVDTLQYFIFDDEPPMPSVDSPSVDDAMELQLIGFAASLFDSEPQLSPSAAPASAASQFCTDADVASSSALQQPGVNVTYGGRMSIKDTTYTSYFLVEVLAMIVRWDQAVAASRLTFFAADSDA